jgi:hypothetical protein
MRVRYQVVGNKLEPYDMCTENPVRRAGKPCQSVRESAIDSAIGSPLLDSVAPAALEVALAVEDEMSGRVKQAAAQRQNQLVRARYDAELARRRYMSVDPTKRLVADTLEGDWNERLRVLDSLQQENERLQNADYKLLSGDARTQIRALAEEVPCVGNDQ